MSTRAPAGFISASWRKPGEQQAPAIYLRRRFVVAPGLRRAVLRVTALGLIDVRVNGEPASDEVLVPGWTSYDRRLIVSTHDVTDRLVAGDNVIGAVLGDGWAVGRLTWEADVRNLWAERPAAFIELTLEYEGRSEVIAGDASWRSSSGPLRENSIYDGESYDARLELDGWARSSYDDSAWSAVDLIDVDPGILTASDAPPIRRVQELPATRVITTPTGRTVVDFGQVLTGWVRLHVTGPAGTTITLRHCETLTAGEPDYSTNRTAQATDRFTLRGQGVERFEPRFTFHGFRYVDVEGWPGELDPGALVAVVVHSDLARIGWLETSNELVNQLHRNVVWSMRGNVVGVPTDCPQRDERLGWTGDINAFAATACFLYDVSGFLASWLADLAAEQAAKGYVPLTVPDAMRTKVSPTALWTDVAVSLPWLLYWQYGDAEILRRQYASMTAFIDSVEPMLDSRGLWAKGFQFGDWLDPDAPPDNPAGGKTDAQLVATAYLCRTTAELAHTADVLGHTGDAERFRQLHERVRDAFRHEWVSPAGLLVSETATAYALAICFDILDPAQKRRAGHRLAQLVAKDGYRISTGFAGTPLVMPALSETGQVETAYRLLLRTECPSFLYPVTMGATSVWERWDAILPDGSLNDTGMTSLNHYALGAVADWLHRSVGGLTATEPGFRAMRIAPRPGGDLTYARLRLDTPHGPVRVGWDVDGRHRRVEVTIPDGTRADVILPGHPQELRPQVGPGVHSWEYTLAPAPRRTYSLDSSVAEIAADPNAWPAVRAVFARHFPTQAPSGEATAGSSAFGSGSLRDILGFVPRHLAERLEADLQDALSP